MLLLKYDTKAALECGQRVKECCEPEKKPGDPAGSGDCCYDSWMKEFKEIDAEYSQADRRVTHMTNRLNNLKSQRDMWKTWKDELEKACDYSKKICTQLEILLSHSSRITRNSWLTKKAIHILFCMLRDFFMQVDLLKKKYDSLVNCIKGLGNPALASGQGIMLPIEEYGKKLDAVILTRDKLMELIVSATGIVNNINKHIGHPGHNYGLHFVLNEWKDAFNCDCKPEREDMERKRYELGRGDRNRNLPEGEIEDIELEPIFKFPICDSEYYKKVDGKYKEDNRHFTELSKRLLDETKHRDNLKALRDGLALVISDQDVDPAKRCASK